MKSDKKLDADRLVALYAKRGVPWKQIAKDLGVGVPMLMMVKSGQRGLSAKSLYRLAEAEKAAGIETHAEAPAPFFNPENDPQVAQRAADIFAGLARTTSELPATMREQVNGHFLELIMLMAERAAAPAKQYMEMLRQEVQVDRQRESKRRKP